MKRLVPLAIALALACSALILYFALRKAPEIPPKTTSESAAPVADPIASPTRAIAPKLFPVIAAAADGGAAPLEPTIGTEVVKGTWGSAPGQFGKRADPESNPEAPMAIAGGAGGEVLVLDQVNRRVQRFKDGKLIGALPVGGDTVQDLTTLADGKTVLLDRLADKNLQVYDKEGKLVNEVPLTGQGVPEGGGVTGVFADDKGIYVEREHGTVVRIADPGGLANPAREELPGRPTRDGRYYITAAIVNRDSGDVAVRAFDRTGKPAWEQVVPLGAPILHLLMLDSDRHGLIYLGADVGHESPTEPYPIVDEGILAVRLGAGGVPRGTLTLPPITGAEETFRPMTVDDDGNILLMLPGPSGVRVVRVAFP